MDKKRLLHIGCGSQPIPDWLSHFDEVRVDIDPACKPHFVRNMLDLHDIGTFDFVFSSHCLEHLYPYQVTRALAEFLRVLNPSGACLVVVPDLEDVKPDTNVIASTGVGPLCGLDMYYGLHTELEVNPHMAHHCGFVQSVLEMVFKAAGFEHVHVKRAGNYNLVGSGTAKTSEHWQALADELCGIEAA